VLASKKWMTFTADFDFYFVESSASGKFVATSASNLTIGVIFWMNICLHSRLL